MKSIVRPNSKSLITCKLIFFTNYQLINNLERVPYIILIFPPVDEVERAINRSPKTFFIIYLRHILRIPSQEVNSFLLKGELEYSGCPLYLKCDFVSQIESINYN